MYMIYVSHKRPTQANKILFHLKKGHSITPLEALKLFECFILGARIDELKKRGHLIQTKMVITNNKKYIAKNPSDTVTALFGINIDKSNFGITTFMQKVNLQRALEGELPITINQMEEVKQSRVHLVIPEKHLFKDTNSGSASIVLYFEPKAYLSKKQTRGVAVLLANSVEGIEMESVSIIDAEGNVLFEEKINDEKKLAGSSEWDVKENVESKMQEKSK